ncbi:MAG TPA: ribonuclease III [Polyangiaceae bacterium]|jgi:ribonuclease-3|nr:ribonuclease III [Polyangiaceae bacterium]
MNEARDELRKKLAAILGTDAVVARFDEALTHPSFSNETGLPHNQRLEFLGDAVLGLCVSELLVTRFPDADEGSLTRMRSALVNATALARFAKKIDLGSALALGRGARTSGEREGLNVLADAVESLVAAVYDTLGIDAARKLTLAVVEDPLAELGTATSLDAKSALQERVQARGEPTPTYRVVHIEGPAHDPRFVVEVLVGDRVLAQGEGASKKSAERAAASAALEKEDDVR